MSSNNILFLEGARTNLSVQHKSVRHLLLPVLFNDEDRQRVCAAFGQNELTVDHLAQKACKVAASLKSYELVAICMHPSLEFIITLCGVILRGIPYVPLEPTFPRERLEYIVYDSQVPLVINDDALVGGQSFNTAKILTYSQLFDSVETMDYEMGEVNSEDTFCLMYTSGSTGQPKGVHLPHRALLNRLDWQWLNFPFDSDVCCLKTSISFLDSVAEIFAPLLRRVPIVVLPKSLLLNVVRLTDVLAAQHITRIILVPSLLTVLLDHLQNSNTDLLDLRLVICSGETLPLHLIESFFSLKRKFSPVCRLINLYGSTEIMADVTCQVFESTAHLYDMLSSDGRTSIGCPINNIRIDIVDPDERGVGELVVRGEGVANGYHYRYANGTALSDKFTRGDDGRLGFCTGDLGKILNGRIILYGRKDNQIKISGNRVDLSEIEFVLKKHCNCRQPVAAYLATNTTIVVFLQETEEAINLDRVTLAKYLPIYAIPTQFITVAEIPLLTSGKIDRQHLINSLIPVRSIVEPPEEGEGSERDRAFIRALAEIGIPRAHMNQSFIAAGGSSLNAISLVAKLHRIGFHGLTVERLINASTLQEILSHSTDDKWGQNRFFEDTNEYQIVALEKVDKGEALHIIIESFANFNELDVILHHNRADLKLEYKRQFYGILDDRWSTYVANGLSFGIIMEDGRLIGISLSNNLANEPDFDPTTGPLFAPLFSMIDAGENELLEQLRSQGVLPQPIFHSFIAAVNPDLKPEQRITAMHFIEQHVLHMAATNQFQTVLTANAGSTTQQLAEHVLKYDINKVLYADQWYDSSGIQVFPHANSSHIMTISIKYIT